MPVKTSEVAQPLITVVIPVYDERANLGVLEARLLPVLDQVADGAFEILFVDDGSRDGSGEMLDAINARDGRCKVIHFSRNFGHQFALQAGLDVASGQAVVLMDADLQDPPELLAQFVAKWKEGYEVVYAIRKTRKESIAKRFAYKVFYRTMKLIAKVDTPIDAGDFCLMDYRVVQTLVSLRERNRFLRGSGAGSGLDKSDWNTTARRGTRENQSTNCGSWSVWLFQDILDFPACPCGRRRGSVCFRPAPALRLRLWAIISKFTAHHVPQGWASTIAVILFIGGAQLVMLGVLGEYLGRVYDEVRQRPLYVVKSWKGFPDVQNFRYPDRS